MKQQGVKLKAIPLSILQNEHLKTFDKFLINGEIWNVKCPKNLNDN